MRLSPLLRQLEIGMSISRYLAASGTAGLERKLVSGRSRVPCPPPNTTATDCFIEVVPERRGGSSFDHKCHQPPRDVFFHCHRLARKLFRNSCVGLCQREDGRLVGVGGGGDLAAD